MLICKDCGYTFQEPVTKTEYTGVNSEGFHEKIRYDVCPHCFSDDIDEAHECIICGAWSDYDYCAVKEILVDRYPRDSFTLATKLHCGFFDTAEGRDEFFAKQLEKTGADRLEIEWAVGDVLDQEF